MSEVRTSEVRSENTRSFGDRVRSVIEWVGRIAIMAPVVAIVVTSVIIPRVAEMFYDAPQASAYASAPIPTAFPVLDRIGDAESGTCGKPGSRHQFNRDGTVVKHRNTNGTIDVGMYQINLSSEHIDLMVKKNFNPFTEEGNKAMAEYIYLNEGTGPWSSSAKCW